MLGSTPVEPKTKARLKKKQTTMTVTSTKYLFVYKELNLGLYHTLQSLLRQIEKVCLINDYHKTKQK